MDPDQVGGRSLVGKDCLDADWLDTVGCRGMVGGAREEGADWEEEEVSEAGEGRGLREQRESVAESSPDSEAEAAAGERDEEGREGSGRCRKQQSQVNVL